MPTQIPHGFGLARRPASDRNDQTATFALCLPFLSHFFTFTYKAKFLQIPPNSPLPLTDEPSFSATVFLISQQMTKSNSRFFTGHWPTMVNRFGFLLPQLLVITSLLIFYVEADVQVDVLSAPKQLQLGQ
jgi:hypothetical protein